MRTRLVALLACTACSGEILPSVEDRPPPPAPEAAVPEAPASPPATPPTEQPPAEGPADACATPPLAATTAPLRRLSGPEYVNTVRDLFPAVELPALEPVADERIGAFRNDVLGQTPSALHVERYASMAEEVARAAVAQLGAWSSCGPEDRTASCAAALVDNLAFKTHRRPLTPSEQSRLGSFTEEAVNEHGFESGVEMAVTALLESPFFIYRPELGAAEPGPAGGVALDDYELASRLSYLFWQSMPDQELFDAAASGALSTETGLLEQAQRLLATDRAREVILGFYWDWLGLDQLDDVRLDDERFPEFNGAMRRDLERSARQFLEKAVLEDDAYESLMLGSFGFVNDRTAPLFDVEAPSADGFSLVELDSSRRRGILTQPGWLAATSHGIGHSPIFRGVKVLDRVLCTPAPPPPPEVLDSVGDPTNEDICTTRDQVAFTHSSGASCVTCHELIDGVGFAFEEYDALGRWRTEENGCTVDASGRLPFRGNAQLVNGAVDVAEQLAESEQVAQCFASHWFRFALGRSDVWRDRCQIEALGRQVLEGEGSLREMMLALVRSPAFRTRPAVE